MNFNPNVHQTKDDQPVIRADGAFSLKLNWKKTALDREGRSYSQSTHGPLQLDDDGYLMVQPGKDVPQVVEPSGQKIDPGLVFNRIVHLTNEHGDPKRGPSGNYVLKPDWKDLATDRQGRKYNPKVHGDQFALDKEGFLKVRRRGETQLVGATNRTEAFINKYREPGYTYRVMNDDGGRMQAFLGNDWEPVMDGDGVATMNVGQARSANTKAFLMKKPIEWYEEDQRKKHDLNMLNTKRKTAPKDGQYEAEQSSPLR
jgi:hypothetical protein